MVQGEAAVDQSHWFAARHEILAVGVREKRGEFLWVSRRRFIPQPRPSYVAILQSVSLLARAADSEHHDLFVFDAFRFGKPVDRERL